MTWYHILTSHDIILTSMIKKIRSLCCGCGSTEWSERLRDWEIEMPDWWYHVFMRPTPRSGIILEFGIMLALNTTHWMWRIFNYAKALFVQEWNNKYCHAFISLMFCFSGLSPVEPNNIFNILVQETTVFVRFSNRL